uniref:Epoxide hydrolase n=1 Tax=Macrostomum lignano TaxID=282301 RepID=A0A1I8HSC4_9PLAT
RNAFGDIGVKMCNTLLPLACTACLAFVLLAGLGCLDNLAAPDKPALPATLNWGASSDSSSDGEAVEATRLSVSNATLDDLRSRLKAFKFVEPVENSGFEYGFNGAFMKQLVSHWLNKYNWRVWEDRLNSFPNYFTRIEGLKVHFMHLKPSKKGVKKRVPLLILHGWPGSVFEFYKLIPLLTTPDTDGLAFEVVAPSIPGYGWSEAAKKRGFSAAACARVFDKLMVRLGYRQYYIQAGDFGSVIGHVMPRLFPERVLGFHTNMPAQPVRQPSIMIQTILGSFLPEGVLFNRLDCGKLFPTWRSSATRFEMGLAAYIIEKFSVWTLPGNLFAENGNLVGLKATFSLDELLTNVMIYWTTGSITSSMRLYKESFGSDMEATSAYQSMPSDVPYGVTCLAHELSRVPERFVRVTNPNLLHYADFDHGGHFAAFELPDLMNSEVRAFVRAAEKFHAEKRPNKFEGVKSEL